MKTHDLPGTMAGRITRESVRRALMVGITARQLLHFMQVHAHPLMMEQPLSVLQHQNWPPIPTTISDQIFLWEQERERLRDATPGVLYQHIPSEAHFAALQAQAEALSGLLWSDSSKRAMVVRQQVQPAMKRFYAEFRQRNG